MTVTDTTVQSSGLFLMAGVNSFIVSYNANILLHLGYAEAFAERHPGGNFETILVPDVNAEGAYEGALDDVQGIVHVAEDMTFGADPNQIITPKANGVRNLLRTAAKSKSVKRFILTRRNCAAFNLVPGEEIGVHVGPRN
ncbi:hypothetical protein EJ02DRAFT_418498 [Clathrospora elynae]|uniref:NAD-dependent epimerase/dehydratase domain-containing protein n=1 Tax=Clathrospora elynae TaxID=706981 RepID=A0A6A5T6J9_9PLEO|nr:hypothetical protein EJ02DRAFT_418498 [Clathrospora elynae]